MDTRVNKYESYRQSNGSNEPSASNSKKVSSNKDDLRMTHSTGTTILPFDTLDMEIKNNYEKDEEIERLEKRNRILLYSLCGLGVAIVLAIIIILAIKLF